MKSNEILEAIEDTNSQITFNQTSVNINKNSDIKYILEDTGLVEAIQDMARTAMGICTELETNHYSKDETSLICWIKVTFILVTVTVGTWVTYKAYNWATGLVETLYKWEEKEEQILEEHQEEVCELAR